LQSVYQFAKEKNIPIFVLGGGSNVVFQDGDLNVLALKIKISGFKIIREDNEAVDISFGAGEIWDKAVEKTVEMNLSGLEALSAIPGTVGATPVQNVGAYGVEVKDTIQEVEVFDTEDDKIKIISNKDCKFGYRDSIFKNEAKGRYVITSVTYRLSKSLPKIPDYPGVKRYFIDNNLNNPHLREIRQAIIEIRKEKLPNPKEIPNVGSFFKNPIVKNEIADEIKKEYPDAKFFPINDTHTKIPAGWLIENAGLRGKSFGKISVYDKNALVLVNNGEATKEDLIKAKNEIIKIVFKKFEIILEQEPEMV
jgi:UDP-N-acetylmuramate dehydrogenase